MECFYCGVKLEPVRKKPNGMGHVTKTTVTRDHLLPASRGGAGLKGNKVNCCARCNFDKGCLTLEEYRLVIALRQRMLPPDLPLPKFKGELEHTENKGVT